MLYREYAKQTVWIRADERCKQLSNIMEDMVEDLDTYADPEIFKIFNKKLYGMHTRVFNIWDFISKRAQGEQPTWIGAPDDL